MLLLCAGYASTELCWADDAIPVRIEHVKTCVPLHPRYHAITIHVNLGEGLSILPANEGHAKEFLQQPRQQRWLWG
jgi:hypothetical protein